MPYVAKRGSNIRESTSYSYVSYTERVFRGYDEFGSAQYDYNDYTTNAKVTGTVNSSGNVYVNGVPIATNGSPTTERWVADPAPYSREGGTIINVSPGTSGSDSGTVNSGNQKRVYANGKLVAVVGSTVTTGLGTSTTVSDGSTNVYIT